MEIIMKKFVVLGIALALAGCDNSKSSPATMADRTNEFDVICLDGGAILVFKWKPGRHGGCYGSSL